MTGGTELSRFNTDSNCHAVDPEGFEDVSEELLDWSWLCMGVYSLQIPHVGASVILSIRSTLNEDVTNEAWALDALQISALSCGVAPASSVPVCGHYPSDLSRSSSVLYAVAV